MNRASMPGVPAIASAFLSASGVSIMAKVRVPSLAAGKYAVGGIGPYDLSTSLSAGKAQDIEAPEVNAAIDKICAAALGAGKIPGIYCRDAQRALDMAKRGFRFMTVGSDFSLVREGSAAALKMLPLKASGARDAF